MAVSNQPLKMMIPTIQGMPPGLQYLAGVDQLFIRQQIEILELLSGFETCNRYIVLNSMEQQVYFVQEESSVCERCFFPNARGFQLHITDNNVQEVMRMSREFKCCTGCCWCADGCCNMSITVEAPVGHVVGYVKTSNSKCAAHIKIFNASNKHLFTLWGPNCPCQTVFCTADINFPITDPSLSTRVANVAKQWGGLLRQGLTDTSHFCLSFPADMTVDSKCLLMGALFLVEYLVFETGKNSRK